MLAEVRSARLIGKKLNYVSRRVVGRGRVQNNLVKRLG
jgi:hypothetical protein